MSRTDASISSESMDPVGKRPATEPAVPKPALAAAERAFDLDELSPAERRVLEQALDGRSVREITESLVLSEATVRSHLARIYAKLGVRGRVELLARVAGTNAPSTSGSTSLARPAPRVSGAETVVVDGSGDRRVVYAASAVLLILLAVGLVIPLLAIPLGPLLVAASLIGRRQGGTLGRVLWPWAGLVGIVLMLWLALIIVGLLAVGGVATG